MVRSGLIRRWSVRVVVLGMAVATGGSTTGAAARAQRPALEKGSVSAQKSVRAQKIGQVSRNDRADVTFELRPAISGNGVTLIARSGDLEIAKTVQPTGDFVLELSSGQEKVTLNASAQGARVSRGKTSHMLRRSDTSDETPARVRRMLAESPVVLKYRSLTTRLMEDDDRTHEALALIMSDATIGMLAGDIGAPRRAARYLVERHNRGVRHAGLAVDCFTLMETRMVEAWNDYGACYYSTRYNTFYQSICSWRWTTQVESYWFNFLSCTGFSFS